MKNSLFREVTLTTGLTSIAACIVMVVKEEIKQKKVTQNNKEHESKNRTRNY